LLTGIILTIFGMPFFVFAHGTRYLEFNPDTTSSLKIADGATPSQVFFPQSDFLGGFDVWLANPGSSGTAVFDLLNEQENVIATKTVAIGNIVETSDGTRFHIDLNSQISVLGNQKYSIKATSSMPELRLYYSNRVKVVAHNAPIASEYITGVGKLGEEEQEFSFKYALYETTETSAPILSNVAWTVISPDQMRVDFNANEPVDYKIEYGPAGQGYPQSIGFTNEYHFCVLGIAACNFMVSVSPNINYQYILTVKDSWGNQSQSSGTFNSGQGLTPTPLTSLEPSTTPSLSPTQTPANSPTGSPIPSSTAIIRSPNQSSPPDNTPPAISNIRTNINDRSIDVAWTTDEIANSHLLISTPFFITITDTSDSTLELEHLLKIKSGLGANVNYVATITSNDAVGNTSKASISFSTLPSIISPPNQPANQNNQSNQQFQEISVSSQNSPNGEGGNINVIRWELPVGVEPSNGYRVDIFDKNGNLVKIILVSKGSNSAQVSDLENGEYSVIVYANNDGVFEKINQPAELKVGDSFLKRLLSFWLFLPVALGLIGFLIWKNIKKKTSQNISPAVP